MPFASLASLSGSIFYTAVLSAQVVEFDSRELVELSRASLGPNVVTVNPGAAYDPNRNEVWVLSTEWTDSLLSVDMSTFQVTSHGPSGMYPNSALSFDRNLGRILVLGPSSYSGVWSYPGWNILSNPGMGFHAADWFDDGGITVALEQSTSAFYAVDSSGIVQFLAPAPPEFAGRDDGSGLAYDSDTRLFWLFDWSGTAWLVEPEGFTVVGQVLFTLPTDGAAGSVDAVPAQTPELLVTGDCPGLMYATVVDATPGGRVMIGSDSRIGNRMVSSGPCAGTTMGLRRPVPRFDLVANSYGIASTTFPASTQMCGRALLQAIDVDTCLTTQVRTAEFVVHP